jgi:hypothetical protein
MIVKYLLAGVAAGAASALYLYLNYHPILLQGAVHAAIFASGLVIAAVMARAGLTARKVATYVAGALPVHLAIHFFVIKDIAQLLLPVPPAMGVSHFLLNLSSSLP